MSAKTWAIVGASVAAVGLIAGTLVNLTRDDDDLIVDPEISIDAGKSDIPVEEPLSSAPPEPSFARRDSKTCQRKIDQLYEAALAYIESTEVNKTKLSAAYNAILAAQEYSRVELVNDADFLDWARGGDATLTDSENTLEKALLPGTLGLPPAELVKTQE